MNSDQRMKGARSTPVLTEISNLSEQSRGARRSFSEEDEFSDVTFVLDDGGRLHLHRQILAEHSPVFRAMFTNNFIEKDQPEINLPGKNVEQFIDFLCTSMYSPFIKIKRSNVEYILALANEYQVVTAKQRCEQHLLTGEPSLDMLMLAQTFDLKQLADRCIAFTAGCKWSELSPYIKDISKEYLERIMEAREQFNSPDTLKKLSAERDKLLASLRSIYETPRVYCRLGGHHYINNVNIKQLCVEGTSLSAKPLRE